MKTTLYTLILLLCAQLSMAGEIAFIEVVTQEDWDNAIAKAKTNNQLVFVDVYTTWCGYCKKMDREVYSQDAVGELYNSNFVNIRLDGEAGIGPEVVQRYEISGFPELLFINHDNKLVTKGVGYLEAEEFQALGKRAMLSWKRLPELQQQLQAGKISIEDGLVLADLLAEQEKNEGAQEVAVKILGNKEVKDLLPYMSWRLMSKYALALDNPLLKKVIKHQKEFVYMRGDEEVSNYFQSCVSSNLADAIKNKNEALMLRVVKELVPLLKHQTSDADRKQMAGITQTMYYQKIEDWEKYSKAVDAYLKDNPTDDDFALSQAKSVLQLEVTSLNESALRWCKSVIDRNPEGKFEAEAFYAITLARTGKKEEAKTMVSDMQTRYANDEQKSALAEELMGYIEQQ